MLEASPRAFAFGDNWACFLTSLSDRSVEQATRSVSALVGRNLRYNHLSLARMFEHFVALLQRAVERLRPHTMAPADRLVCQNANRNVAAQRRRRRVCVGGYRKGIGPADAVRDFCRCLQGRREIRYEAPHVPDLWRRTRAANVMLSVTAND